MGARPNSSDLGGRLLIGGTGAPGQVRLGKADPYAQVAASANGVLALSTWHRLCLTLDQAGGRARTWVFPLGSDTAIWDSGWIASDFGSDADRVEIGALLNSPTIGTVRLAALLVTDGTSGPLGRASWDASNLTSTQDDGEGIADTASRSIAATRGSADPVGLTDAVAAVVTAVRTIADAAAVIDTPGEQTLAISLPLDDDASIADSASQMMSAARSIADGAAIADSATASILALAGIADQEGLTDSSSAATSAARGPAEAAGIGDQAAATLAVTRTPSDQLGATDSVTVSITSAGDALVTDTVGAVDQVTVSATSSRTIADGLTLTDGATAILTAGAMPVETIGLGDTVTAELTATRDVSEAIGVIDQVAAFLLSRGEAVDPAGISDQVAAEIQRTRQADDVTEVSDTLATLAVSVRTLTDTGTLTDVVTAVLAPSVAPLGRTLLVYYERRYRPGWTGTIDHDPQAKLDYTWDWTDWLGDDTITSSTVTAKVEEARDPTDVVTIDDVWPSPKTITAWISGGVHGTPCAVTCRITTTAGRIDDRTIRLRVRDR